MTQQNPIAANQAMFRLEYPQSLGVFDSYPEAQKAVDHLADQNFPVANLAIVGTDLRLVERVTGRRTWGTVLGQGVMSGLSTGFIVAIFMMLLFPSANFLGQLLTALVIGVAIGLLFAVLGYVVSRGQRDFTSVTQTIATKYEILCEHKVMAQARELLAQAPGARASQFNQPGAQAWQQGQPWQQGPQGQTWQAGPQPWQQGQTQPGQWQGQSQQQAGPGQQPWQPGGAANQGWVPPQASPASTPQGWTPPGSSSSEVTDPSPSFDPSRPEDPARPADPAEPDRPSER